jgi:antitoxin VapB
MTRTKVVRLFKNGASQAVRLPAEFRFSGSTVYATHDEATGDVVLSTRPGARHWEDFFERMRSIDVPKDFMAERPMNRIPKEESIFGDDE